MDRKATSGGISGISGMITLVCISGSGTTCLLTLD